VFGVVYESTAPQEKLVNAPQAPVKSCIRMVVEGVTLLSVMMCWLEVAVKRYHTSSSAVPVHGVATMPLFVALCNVPAVCAVQLRPVLTGNTTAATHSSFAGGGGGVPIQIWNVMLDAPVAHP